MDDFDCLMQAIDDREIKSRNEKTDKLFKEFIRLKQSRKNLMLHMYCLENKLSFFEYEQMVEKVNQAERPD